MNYAPKNPKLYYDWGSNKSMAKAVITCDQSKMNLTWLVFPEIDDPEIEYGLDAVSEDYAKSLDNLDKQTAAALLHYPSRFMGYWKKLKHWDLLITEFMPEDYMERMEAQAAKAQARLLPVEGNVVQVKFGRKK